MSEGEEPLDRAAAVDERGGRGALIGLLVGDALAAAREGRTTGACLPLTLGLASSLKEHGRFFPTDVTRRYVEIAQVGSGLDDVTHISLSMIARGVSIGEASRRAFLHADRGPSGDGALARVAPIGVALSKNATLRRFAALADCAITHVEPRRRVECAAVCAAIAEASAGFAEATDMLAAARREIDLASSALVDLVPRDGPDMALARAALHDDLALAESDDPKLHDGFVHGAFVLAFRELLHASSFESALTGTLERGGEVGPRAAVVGALLGARFGEAGIPASWIERALLAVEAGALGSFLALADAGAGARK